MPSQQRLLGAAGMVGVAAFLYWAMVSAPGKAVEAREGAPAPALRLADLSGETATLSHYKGKVVLLDFWATWCLSCQDELPSLKALHAKYRARGFEILGASVDGEGRKVLMPFVAENAIPWRVVLADSATAKAYGVLGLPTKYLIDGNGVVARKYVGPVEPEELEKDVARLLGPRT